MNQRALRPLPLRRDCTGCDIRANSGLAAYGFSSALRRLSRTTGLHSRSFLLLLTGGGSRWKRIRRWHTSAPILTTCRGRKEAQIKSAELWKVFRATSTGAILRVRTFLFSKRFLRSALAVILLLILTWFFGQAGILEKLDRVAGDIQFRLNPVPYDTAVVLVTIDDGDY